MTAPNSPTREITAQLAQILDRLDALERGRASQLGNSSLDGTYLRVNAADGTTLQTWGVQPDGSASTRNFDPKPPPRPNTPVVTSAVAGLLVEWNGELVGEKPGNFSHVTLHVSPVEGFVPSDSNQIAALREAGSFPAAPLDYVTHYVKLVAWTTSDVASEPSFEQHGSPGKVVADEVLRGVVDELGLADGAVKEAKLAAGAVTSTKVGDDAITTPKLVAGAVQTSKLATGAVTTEKLVADAVTAEKLAALSVTSDKMTANSVTAGTIAAGSVDATKLAANLVLGSRVIAGDPIGTRVELSGSGLLVVRADGDTTFSVDSSTGDVVSMGEYYTSRFGERIAMNSGGFSSPMIRAYPDRGSYYASLGARTSSTPSGDRVAYWGVRVPYLNTSLVGFFEFLAEDAGSKADINPSKLWYRPYVAQDFSLIPGWEAYHQDVALTFFNGGLYARDKDNLAARDVLARSFYADARGSFDNVEIKGNAIFSRDRDGAISWDPTGALIVSTRNGAGGRGVYATNFAPWGSSWRGLKTDHTSIADYLGHSALDEVRGLDIQAWRYRQTFDQDQAGHPDGDDRMRIGLHLDELHPRLRLGGEREDRGDATTWDTIEMLNVALAAVQDQADEVDTLKAEVAALRARVEELEPTP